MSFKDDIPMKTEMDKNIQIPSDLEASIEKMLDGMDAASRILADGKTSQKGPQPDSQARIARIKRSFLSITAAASIVLMGWLGYGMVRNSAPQDTFDDPKLAYAEVERVLSSISSNMQHSVRGVEKADEILGIQKEVYGGIKHSHNRNN